jgi:hypothetical protein
LRLKPGHPALLVFLLEKPNFSPRASPEAPAVAALPGFRQQRGDHIGVIRLWQSAAPVTERFGVLIRQATMAYAGAAVQTG